MTKKEMIDINEMHHIKAAVVGLKDRVNFGISGVQRVCKIGYNNACRIVERALREGYFCHNHDYPEYQNLRVSAKGLELAEAQLNHPASVGDIVEPLAPSYALRSGAQAYDFAIVVSMSPFVLVSERADMRWQSTVNPKWFKVIGEATQKQLDVAMAREYG